MSAPTLVEKFKWIGGGPLTERELAFCQLVVDLTDGVLAGELSFRKTFHSLLLDMRAVRQSVGSYDLDLAFEQGWKPTAEDPRFTLRTQDERPLSDSEKTFLADMQGFVRFAVRNGLTFRSVLIVVMHDWSELGNSDFDFERMRKEFYVHPKVSGWAKMNEQTFGESEEREE